jgi:hypothetical protein
MSNFLQINSVEEAPITVTVYHEGTDGIQGSILQNSISAETF